MPIRWVVRVCESGRNSLLLESESPRAENSSENLPHQNVWLLDFQVLLSVLVSKIELSRVVV